MQQDINVQATCPIEFLQRVQEAIIRGARYKEGTYVSLKTLPLMAEMIVEIGEDPQNEWKDKGPHIWAIPFPKTQLVYSKEQLEALDWEVFKKLVKDTTGESGRDRNLLTSKYLKYTNQV
jgi:hypothetical protein